MAHARLVSITAIPAITRLTAAAVLPITTISATTPVQLLVPPKEDTTPPLSQVCCIVSAAMILPYAKTASIPVPMAVRNV